MPKLKTQKSVSERFKITKSNKGSKVLKRTAGQDHFNSREPGKVTRNKRRDKNLSKTNIRTVKTLINS